ncbi:hypothetical protein GIB67_027259 [Kingdonia uniflora]|uniref:DUF4283 domain-containing protein n=1 Tax=Kingdonia uniflora TaxID=39325 RepID=A0A7J7KYC6_9MAGN|nr:hypothetical protein GIB67_027259 [Kingdonia uniflora]
MLDGVTILQSDKVKNELILDRIHRNDVELVSHSDALTKNVTSKKKVIMKFFDAAQNLFNIEFSSGIRALDIPKFDLLNLDLEDEAKKPKINNGDKNTISSGSKGGDQDITNPMGDKPVIAGRVNNRFKESKEGGKTGEYPLIEIPDVALNRGLASYSIALWNSWSPNFNLDNQKSSNALMWVRFQGLSLEYWDVQILISMGLALATPVQVDNATKNQAYQDFGLFARVLVDIDISQPIPNK